MNIKIIDREFIDELTFPCTLRHKTHKDVIVRFVTRNVGMVESSLTPEYFPGQTVRSTEHFEFLVPIESTDNKTLETLDREDLPVIIRFKENHEVTMIVNGRDYEGLKYIDTKRFREVWFKDNKIPTLKEISKTFELLPSKFKLCLGND